MKSLYTFIIVFVCLCIVACSNNNTDNQPKGPIVQSVNLGKLDVKRGIGGDKDFVELKRLLPIDSIDVIELYWMQDVNAGIADCILKYGKNDSSFIFTVKVDKEEHTIREKCSKDKIMDFVNTPDANWNNFDSFIAGNFPEPEIEENTMVLATIRIISKSKNPYQITINGNVIGNTDPYEEYEYTCPPGYYQIKAVQVSGYAFSPTINNREVNVEDGETATITIGYKD